MSANLDDARRAYEAAKRFFDRETSAGSTYQSDARLLLTNATSDYAQALVDEQLRKFDGAGIKVGETVVDYLANDEPANDPFVIERLEADVKIEKVWAVVRDKEYRRIATAAIRPYTAPEAGHMVLTSFKGLGFAVDGPGDRFRLTLSNVTPADLDAMKPGEVIEGTFKIEGVGK